MNRTEYILRSLSKISSKKWEHYAINRIYHRLNDPDIEFVCQQCIRKGNKIYLADLYLPQLDMYLEIDEGHHNHDLAKIEDAKRSLDIAEVSNFTEERIPASDISLEDFNKHIDDFVTMIAKRKNYYLEKRKFVHWDYERPFTAAPHAEAGFIEIDPHSAFRTHKDALNCFGYSKGHYQRGVWNIPSDIVSDLNLTGHCMVWFPKLYNQKNWDNSLSSDGKAIYEVNKNTVIKEYNENWDKRIVMAHSKDELNRTLYRFLGVFEIIPEYSTGRERRFRRIATKVSTYSVATPAM